MHRLPRSDQGSPLELVIPRRATSSIIFGPIILPTVFFVTPLCPPPISQLVSLVEAQQELVILVRSVFMADVEVSGGWSDSAELRTMSGYEPLISQAFWVLGRALLLSHDQADPRLLRWSIRGHGVWREVVPNKKRGMASTRISQLVFA